MKEALKNKFRKYNNTFSKLKPCSSWVISIQPQPTFCMTGYICLDLVFALGGGVELNIERSVAQYSGCPRLLRKGIHDERVM